MSAELLYIEEIPTDVLMRTPRYRKLVHRLWLASQLRSLCAQLAQDDGLTLEKRRGLIATADNLVNVYDETAAEMSALADEVLPNA